MADIQACCESKKCDKVRNSMTALEDKKFCILAADKVVHTCIQYTRIASDCSHRLDVESLNESNPAVEDFEQRLFLGQVSRAQAVNQNGIVNAQATAWIRRSAAQSIPSNTAETRGGCCSQVCSITQVASSMAFAMMIL